MIQIAICDRSAEHALKLEALIRKIDGISIKGVEQFHNAREFLQRLDEPRMLDIVFIDVTFDPDAGLLLARELGRKQPSALIIFTSCYVAHAVDITGAPHVYFLVKPYEPERVRDAMEKAKASIDAARERRVLIPMRGNSAVVLSQNQIVYFERMRRTTVVNCCDGNYETGLKLSELEELLPSPQFTRPHNSYLINLAFVKKIERFCLHLNNGEVLPISNQRRPLFREALEEYLNK